ncbi:AbrB/MazE/SpoVT family DNA-binding domain-containing protein [Deinococcus lacus]|uniref:AbrB/MazE/SpoVT family DNA-binding domain-containing protein n=1 Tax=Deinococcus lacus TaxID=392561 RepID=A0ABW1YFM8_9DEIO
MTAQIQKWGNSLALRIPKAIAEQVGIAQSSEIEFIVQDGKIIISPVQPKQYDLAALVAQITPENLHGETDWGAPQGREEW